MQLNAATSLTADHIMAGSLVIGGDATNSALVTIAASNPDGSPTASTGFALAGSLASDSASSGFAGNGLSAADLLAGAVRWGSELGRFASRQPEPRRQYSRRPRALDVRAIDPRHPGLPRDGAAEAGGKNGGANCFMTEWRESFLAPSRDAARPA